MAMMKISALSPMGWTPLYIYPEIFDMECVSSLSRPSSQRTQRRHSPTYCCIFKNKFL